jgi:hypothetical protein
MLPRRYGQWQDGAMHPLVEESAKKAAIAWIEVPGVPAYALWCLWVDDALYVVSGPGEQSAPELKTAAEATVRMRGDHGGQIVAWRAEVNQLVPGGEQWREVAPQLAAKRLNAPGTAEELALRWSHECAITQLRPLGEVASGAGLPDGSQAAAPRETPATQHTKAPFRLHRVKRARRLSP